MKFGPSIKFLAQALRSKHPVMLFGAGVSRASGLPAAAELQYHLLRRLCTAQLDRRLIVRSPIPFEAFMECIAAYADIKKIIAIFASGVPNTTHHFMAKLARQDNVDTFATTNFDPLLERALPPQDFIMRATDRRLARWRPGKRVVVLKLHGSVENYHSIRTTLRAVASRQLSAGRATVVRRLLMLGQPIVVMGYSGSDAFDITPMIKTVKPVRTQVFYIDHCVGRARAVSLDTLPAKNPFRHFAGIRFQADTDNVVRALWHLLALGRYERASGRVEWKKQIDDWAHTLEPGASDLITAKLLFQASRAQKATEYCRTALAHLTDRTLRGACWTLLAQAQHMRGAYGEAERCLQEALKIIPRSDENARASVYEKLGGTMHNRGKYSVARKHYERALQLAKRDAHRQSLCHSGLGSVAYRMQDFAIAKDHYEKAVALSERIGFKVGEAAFLLNLGNVHAAQHSHAAARKAYAAAKDTAELTGYAAGELTARIALADLDVSRKRYDDAWTEYDEALARARELSYGVRIINCLIGRGTVSLARHEFSDAIADLQKARRIAHKREKFAEEAEACEGIATAHFRLKRVALAIRYYAMAADIYRSTLQHKNLFDVLTALAKAHKRTGDTNRADRCRDEQRQIQRNLPKP